MARSFVIAIDGPSAAGKGTLARKIAAHYHFAHLDTGALYRALAYGLHISGLEKTEQNAAKMAARLEHGWLSNRAIRTEEIGNIASQVSAFSKVRQALKAWQQDFAKNPPAKKKGAVLDGRDIGTVICPEADVKLFITASIDARAKRRCKELQDKGEKAIYAQILRDIEMRDKRDRERSTAPLAAAEDAMILDTSDLNAEEVFAVAKARIEQAMRMAQ